MKLHPPRLPHLLTAVLASVLLIGVGSLILSCGARSPLGKDGRSDATWISPDGPRLDHQPFDGSIPPDIDRDKIIWPDAPSKDDAWPKNDIYPGGGGTPFGCFTDADCFHLRCCATPWGIKVCMEHCP